MKRLIVLSLLTTLSLSTVAFAETGATAVVTSNSVTTTAGNNVTAVAPLLVVDRETMETLVPLREEAKALGYKTEWSNEKSAIVLTQGTDTFECKVGSQEYIYNGNVALTAAAPKLVKGVTYVSPKFINLITPYNNQPQIQDPTGSDGAATITPEVPSISTDSQIEDPMAAAGLSDATIENMYSVINPIKKEFSNEIDSKLAEDKKAYLASGGSEENYVEPEHQVGVQFINFTRDYYCVDVYGYLDMGTEDVQERYLTFDINTGDLVTLEDIYGDDYNTYVKSRILDNVAYLETTYPGEYDFYQEGLENLEITNETNFFVDNSNQLFVVLPQGSVIDESYGSPKCLITNYSNDLPVLAQ